MSAETGEGTPGGESPTLLSATHPSEQLLTATLEYFPLAAPDSAETYRPFTFNAAEFSGGSPSRARQLPSASAAAPRGRVQRAGGAGLAISAQLPLTEECKSLELRARPVGCCDRDRSDNLHHSDHACVPSGRRGAVFLRHAVLRQEQHPPRQAAGAPRGQPTPVDPTRGSHSLFHELTAASFPMSLPVCDLERRQHIAMRCWTVGEFLCLSVQPRETNTESSTLISNGVCDLSGVSAVVSCSPEPPHASLPEQWLTVPHTIALNPKGPISFDPSLRPLEAYVSFQSSACYEEANVSGPRPRVHRSNKKKSLAKHV
ncbi:hypothetical protein EYF80_036872 [Liparis tanakae]|uniref:Uncharacterized protein n=1 Tax=Liparis tanakae TaxID=230148 RepID=A0A4Z2GJF7_9TELE|nr:hypothetical protein EYF80_036872 [Liparis tanakae]